VETQTIDRLLDEIDKIEKGQSATAQSHSGFQYSDGPFRPDSKATAQQFSSSAKPLPHRPKGKILTAIVLLSVLGFGGFQLWHSFFRYAAYGVVAAHLVAVSAPMDGTIRYVHVREGVEVQQGQLIVTLHDLNAQHRLERVSDELRMAQANLSAEMAKLRWQMQVQQLEQGESSAEYFEAAARLEQEIATQKNAEGRLDRSHKLHAHSAITQAEYDKVLYDHQGQTEKVARLREALKSWQYRASAVDLIGNMSMEQIDPMLVRIESLQSELRRARETLKQGEVRSPVNGRIVRWHVRAGEFIGKSQGLFSVFEEGSSHVKLHLPQRAINRFVAGDVVDLEVLPLFTTVSFTVDRIGDDLENPPGQTELHYSPNEKLLPVYLSLKDTPLESVGIPIGAQVRLASEWFSN
jgi:multidrug resistance efflux pump